jgi:hypothetical protein
MFLFSQELVFYLGMENQQSKPVPEKKKVAVSVPNGQRETNHTDNSLGN